MSAGKNLEWQKKLSEKQRVGTTKDFFGWKRFLSVEILFRRLGEKYLLVGKKLSVGKRNVGREKRIGW